MALGILIDLDDTLLDDGYAMRQAALALHELHEDLRAAPADDVAERWASLAEEQWRRFRSGEISFQEQRRERVRGLFARAFSELEADAIFAGYLAQYERHWRMVQGASEFLDRTSHVPKAIVSNGERGQVLRKVERLGLRPYFVAVVTPEDAGTPKPDPGIFLEAANKLGLKPGECLMIGDNYEVDIAPALALGMATFHVAQSVEGRRIVDAVNALTTAAGRSNGEKRDR